MHLWKSMWNLPARLLFGMALCAMASQGFATTPSIAGSYSGSGAETDGMCSDPTDNGTFAGMASVDIQDLGSGSFSGSGVIIDTGETFSIGGTISANGSVSGSWSSTASGSGSFSGSLQGDVLSVSYSGSDAFCSSISGSAKLSRGNTVVPENAPGVTLTAPANLQTFTRFFAQTFQQRFIAIRSSPTATGARPMMGGLMLQGGAGLAAGDGTEYPVGVWASYSRSDSKDSFVSTAFKSDRDSFLAGIDVRLREDVALGVAVGYEDSNATTTFNRGKQDSNGYTLAPYLGWFPTDSLSLDLAVGYSNIDIDQFRTIPGSTVRVTSSPNSTRRFASGNVNAYTSIDNWHLNGRAGLLWAEDEQDSFTESDGTSTPSRTFQVGQLRIGGDVAYTLGNWEPFANLTFEHDYKRTKLPLAAGVPQQTDSNGGTVGVGVRYFADNGITASLEYNTVIQRKNFDDDTYSVLVRYDF